MSFRCLIPIFRAVYPKSRTRVAFIKISKSNVARGTPCNTDAIPPMTTYFTVLPFPVPTKFF